MKQTAIIVTNSGQYLDLLDPDPEAIFITDIAHSLANINRFNGHTDKPYSVGQHSIYCSRIVSDRHALQALLHDSTEAYMGDMVSPLKSVMQVFRAIEDKLWTVIASKFGVPSVLQDEVKWADEASYCMERRKLIRARGQQFDPDYERFVDVQLPVQPLPVTLTPEETASVFLERFQELDR